MNLFQFTFIFIVGVVSGKFCKEFIDSKVKQEFHLLRSYRKSNKTVIAVDNFVDVNLCAEFALQNQGLAFNFSPWGRRKSGLFINEDNSRESISEKFFNCEVLDCPEFANFSSSLLNDTLFDYYSLYTKKLPAENSVCIPEVGMFKLFKQRTNYTTANGICASYGGNLAHVASDIRNIKLSRLLKHSTISSKKEKNAYVGLSELEPIKRGDFRTSKCEPLACFNFRAWAPGHPPEIRKQGCVALTPEGWWKVFNCNRKLLFICELLTS